MSIIKKTESGIGSERAVDKYFDEANSNFVILELLKPITDNELFFLHGLDETGSFRFQSAYKFSDLPQGFKIHHMMTLNSFYKKPRSIKTLRSLYAINIDLDCKSITIPYSYFDILKKWQELGFTKEPTLIISTSPGRFHVIILLKPLKAYPEKISYWEKCAGGLCTAFKEFNADRQASTNPVGLIRIPGHINFKYPVKPIVESVFESDSTFTLSEIYDKLIENEIFTKADKTYSTSVNENIKLLERGVQERFRNNSCFTLAIYYKEEYKLFEEDCLNEIMQWNLNNNPPLPVNEIKSSVSSAYRNGYKISNWWINTLAENVLNTTEADYARLKVSTQIPKRVPLHVHANKITQYICYNGGYIELSISQLSRLLNIPKSSFFEAIKLIPELNINPINKGRNAKSSFSLKPGLKLAQ